MKRLMTSLAVLFLAALPSIAAANVYANTCSAYGGAPSWILTLRCHIGNNSNNDFIYVKETANRCLTTIANPPWNNGWSVFRAMAPGQVHGVFAQAWNCPEWPTFWQWHGEVDIHFWNSENNYVYIGPTGSKNITPCPN